MLVETALIDNLGRLLTDAGGTVLTVLFRQIIFDEIIVDTVHIKTDDRAYYGYG